VTAKVNLPQEQKNKFEDTEGVIRSCKSKKDRQKWAKRTNNDVQNMPLKTNDWAKRIPLKTGGELRWSERVSSSCSTCDTVVWSTYSQKYL